MILIEKSIIHKFWEITHSVREKKRKEEEGWRQKVQRLIFSFVRIDIIDEEITPMKMRDRMHGRLG